MNPFAATTNILLMQNSLSELNNKLKHNRMFSVVDVDGLTENELEPVLKETASELAYIVQAAYLSMDDVSNAVIINTLEDGYSRTELTIIFPLDENNNTLFCSNPDLYKSYLALKNSPDFQPRRSMPIDLESCPAVVYSTAEYYENSVNSRMTDVIPKGDFIVQSAKLPPMFPLNKLNSESGNIYLYQPTRAVIKDKNVVSLLESNPDLVESFWNKGYFVDQPVVTNVGTREVLEFGLKK